MCEDFRSPGNEDLHYYGAVQPIDLIESMQLDWHQGSAIAYIARCKRKGGVLDIDKAIWVLKRYRDVLTREGAPRAAADYDTTG